MKKLVLFGMMVGGAAALVEARTVALWPFERDENGSLDGRCMVNPSNDLELHVTSGLTIVNTELGWQLPPNPDEQGHLRDINNYHAVANSSQSGAFAKTASAALFDTLTALGDYTIEGWIKFDGLPGRGDWKPFFQSVAGGVNIMLSIRHTRKNATYATTDNPDGYYYTIEAYHRGANADKNPGGDHQLVKIAEQDMATFAASWHHLAMELDHSNSSSTKLRLFVDGEQRFNEQTSKFYKLDDNAILVYFGGRKDDSAQVKMDYWRISDEALPAEKLLCYDPEGKGGKQIREHSKTTLAYWKLDVDENGVIDMRNAVGDYAHLRKASFIAAPGNSGDMGWAEPNGFEPCPDDCAFAGSPANSDIAFQNGGSISLQRPAMGLKTYGLGERLLPTASFTVEGWYNPAQEQGAARYDTNEFGRVFAIADPDTIWSLRLKKLADGTRKFAVEAIDDTTKGGGSALASGEFSATLPQLDQWHHLALVYDAAEGNGSWKFYFDGVSAGTVANGREPNYAGELVATNAFLGSTTVPGKESTKSKTGYAHTVPGRAASDWVLGKYDCWRVSASALAPSEFLNAQEGSASTSTLALWPLDCYTNGVNLWLEGRDKKNAYHFTGNFYKTSDFQNKSVTDGLVTVMNPDASANFVGNPAVNGGASIVASGKAYYFCDDPQVLELFGNGYRDMTFEFYSKRTEAMRNWEIIFTGCNINLGYGTDAFNFSSRANGIQLYMNCAGLTGDKLFANSLNPVNDTTTWHHFALVRKCEGNKVYTSLYEDGELCETKNGTPSYQQLANMTFFARSSGNDYRAAVDEVRLSSAALEPSQFLCANNEGPVTPSDTSRKTMGYWKMENDGGAAVLGNSIVLADALSGSAVGSTEKFVANGRIRNPDATTNFVGNAGYSYGSVLASSSLSSAYAGQRLGLTSPWTIEGWTKLASPSADGYDLCSVANDDDSGYWKLRVVKDGDAVRLSLKAQSPISWTAIPVNGSFDADLAGDVGQWVHLALAYDPSVGNGTWTLYVNGKKATPIENSCALRQENWGLNGLTLGDDAQGCAFDEWRISRSALNAEGLLYRFIPGMVLFVF